MRVNRDEKDKELWLRVRYKKEFDDLHELFEKIFCITSATVELVFSTSGLSIQLNRRRGQQSELVMKKVTSTNLSLCYCRRMISLTVTTVAVDSDNAVY